MDPDVSMPGASGPGTPGTPGPGTPSTPSRPGTPSAAGGAQAKARAIIAGLGGAANILEIEPCITRLRTEVRDGTLVNEAVLKSAGAHGVSRRGAIVQVIVGPEADVLAQDIEDQLG